VFTAFAKSDTLFASRLVAYNADKRPADLTDKVQRRAWNIQPHRNCHPHERHLNYTMEWRLWLRPRI